jgi:hypothetical protein
MMPAIPHMILPPASRPVQLEARQANRESRRAQRFQATGAPEVNLGRGATDFHHRGGRSGRPWIEQLDRHVHEVSGVSGCHDEAMRSCYRRDSRFGPRFRSAREVRFSHNFTPDQRRLPIERWNSPLELEFRVFVNPSLISGSPPSSGKSPYTPNQLADDVGIQ